jgi:hypothetical protein
MSRKEMETGQERAGRIHGALRVKRDNANINWRMRKESKPTRIKEEAWKTKSGSGSATGSVHLAWRMIKQMEIKFHAINGWMEPERYNAGRVGARSNPKSSSLATFRDPPERKSHQRKPFP